MGGEISLPLTISSHRCANGETMEWRLSAGDSKIETIYVSNRVRTVEATRRLFAKLGQRTLFNDDL